MSAFLVTVRQLGHAPLTYSDIATDSCMLIMAAQDRFGPCSVSVKPSGATAC
jgi:hypothetical protein